MKCSYGIRSLLFAISLLPLCLSGQSEDVVSVEGQPLAANVNRLLQTLEFLGAPLDETLQNELKVGLDNEDSSGIQKVLDQAVLFIVDIIALFISFDVLNQKRCIVINTWL